MQNDALTNALLYAVAILASIVVALDLWVWRPF
jgi:hypothetical protein